MALTRLGLRILTLSVLGALGCGATEATTMEDGAWMDATEGAASESGTVDAIGEVADTADANVDVSDKAAVDADLEDAATFACGDASCASWQICLYPAYGCIALAMPDSGVCPDGMESVGSDGCLPPPPPPS